ncbi:MAG: hypothetical protein NTY53_27325 [Kiritimatiellaeota bacterium]|nr:hypothetical protein [Kiritimatiellota bacterium]
MNEQNETPKIDGIEMAKQLGKAAVQGGINAIAGKNHTSALRFAVIGFRILGVTIFLMSVFKLWWFEYYEVGVGYFKTVLTGFVIGFTIYCHGELINLLTNIEAHLRKIATKAELKE